jgi:hypothetical protein
MPTYIHHDIYACGHGTVGILHYTSEDRMQAITCIYMAIIIADWRLPTHDAAAKQARVVYVYVLDCCVSTYC